jgi:metal-responsive CopG/Arc/MetJ family transcriptional regulator
MTRVILKPVKTAVSLPDDLFRRAEEAAARQGLARSRLYALAIAEYLERHRHDGVTEALNAVYDGESSTVESDLAEAQRRALGEEVW